MGGVLGGWEAYGRRGKVVGEDRLHILYSQCVCPSLKKKNVVTNVSKSKSSILCEEFRKLFNGKDNVFGNSQNSGYFPKLIKVNLNQVTKPHG